MGHIITDLKETFRRGNIFIQLIYINVSIFIIGTLINVFLQLFQHSIPDIFGIFALPASFIRFFHQPWSIITYMFMHAGLLHILFNMLWLYWFGSLFLHFFFSKAFKRFVHIGRYPWRFIIYGCLQCISFVQSGSSSFYTSRSFGFRLGDCGCHCLP